MKIESNEATGIVAFIFEGRLDAVSSDDAEAAGVAGSGSGWLVANAMPAASTNSSMKMENRFIRTSFLC